MCVRCGDSSSVSPVLASSSSVLVSSVPVSPVDSLSRAIDELAREVYAPAPVAQVPTDAPAPSPVVPVVPPTLPMRRMNAAARLFALARFSFASEPSPVVPVLALSVPMVYVSPLEVSSVLASVPVYDDTDTSGEDDEDEPTDEDEDEDDEDEPTDEDEDEDDEDEPTDEDEDEDDEDDNTTICECCHSETSNDDVCVAFDAERDGRRNERIVCDECCFRCASCDEYYYGESTDHRRRQYCRECFNDNFSSCENCSHIMENDESVYDEPSEQTLCSECYSDLQREREDDERAESEETDDYGVREYGYKPSPVFHEMEAIGKGKRLTRTPTGGERYFGLEVEVEYGSATNIRKHIETVCESDLWYAKHDGSLDNGCEFVSHPATLAFWRHTGFAWCNSLASKGFGAWNKGTCGLHIHISRDSMGEFDWFKLGMFFRDNKQFIESIARRSCSQYAAIDPHESNASLIRKAKRLSGGPSRYVGLNFDNSKTVEFRIFRGTLRATSVVRNLEVTNALCEFARTTGLHSMRAIEFVTWLRNVAPIYLGESVATNLYDWCAPMVGMVATNKQESTVLASSEA